jgi:hypothetical protein
VSESCAARSHRAGRARLFALRDVTPSLNVYCKHTRIQQYLKENRALRTETTINNTYDFGIGRKPRNPPKLLEVGFAVNSVTTACWPKTRSRLSTGRSK